MQTDRWRSTSNRATLAPFFHPWKDKSGALLVSQLFEVRPASAPRAFSGFFILTRFLSNGMEPFAFGYSCYLWQKRSRCASVLPSHDQKPNPIYSPHPPEEDAVSDAIQFGLDSMRTFKMLGLSGPDRQLDQFLYRQEVEGFCQCDRIEIT